MILSFLAIKIHSFTHKVRLCIFYLSSDIFREFGFVSFVGSAPGRAAKIAPNFFKGNMIRRSEAKLPRLGIAL